MSTTSVSLRDHRWLDSRLRDLWQSYYHDAPRCYPIAIEFGPRARYRYGSIYSIDKQCHILINRLFAHPDVPDYVIEATIAHELAHYVHGYGSGLPKVYRHPHRGGVVEKEMHRRGCLHLEERASVWRRDHWQAFYAAAASDATARRKEREKRDATRWEMFLSTPGFRTEADLRGRAQALAPLFGLSEAPFRLSWLYASLRRNGLSYRFEEECAVRLHGILADPNVPDVVIDYELSYWLAVTSSGAGWQHVEQALKTAGVWREAKQAIRWRRAIWPNYYLLNHPLKSK